jgi:CheY-like chemotaxis protein
MSESHASEARPFEGRRILIVDDNLDQAESLALVLECRGHATCVACDGPTALAAAALWGPDTVLLDIGLPGMSGYDVCRRLRTEPGGPALLIIAVTAWAAATGSIGSLAAGFDAHLVKPIDHPALERLLSAPRDSR